jgi:hypothetical protein
LKEQFRFGRPVEGRFMRRSKQKANQIMKKTRFNLLAAGLCAAGLFAGMLSVAQASVAFAPSGSSIVPGEPSGNDALFFTPNVNITVTALGYYDGVTYAHGVGLYEVTSVVGNPTDYSGTVSGVSGATTLTSITGNLLASSSINGSGGSLVNNFYYNPITPVTLVAGQLYAVDGYYAGPPDLGVYATGGVGADPSITFDYYLWDFAGSGPDLPLNTYSTPILGPNFQFVAVPEPTTISLIAIGLLGALTIRRRKV